MIIKLINKLIFSIFITISILGQAGTYYDLLTPSSSSFITDLEGRIRSPYTRITYDQFDETNVANFASRDTTNGQKVFTDVYSGENCVYTPPFAYGNAYSREHTWCQSWFPVASTSNDYYSDQHHLYPVDQPNVNGRRSNNPLGEVVSATYTFLECKLGTSSTGEVVFEPRASHKGDAARALLYMALRYNGVTGFGDWTFNYLNTHYLASQQQDIAVLLKWHKQDPPDKWEIDRNNYVQSIQKNRNPLIDHPEYANYIDFSNLSKLSPTFAAEPTNYPTGFTATASGSSVTLNWTAAAAGSQAPSQYLIQAFKYNNYFIPMDGVTYTNDVNFTDGAAQVLVDYGTNTYTFSGLANGTYYFAIFDLNGSGTSVNYKSSEGFLTANAIVNASSSTTVSFSTPSAVVSEGVGTYTITASITNPSATTATTASIALTSGVASNINNFSSQTITFPAGSSASRTVTLTVVDDQIVQGPRTLTFGLQNVSGGTSAAAASPSSFGLTITDNDGITSVAFSSASATVSEAGGTYNLTLAITNPSATAATTADIALTVGDASNVNNYTTQTVTFPANSSASQTVTLTLTNDLIVNSTRTLTFSIADVTGGNSVSIGSQSTFDLTITDNDVATTVSFASASATVSEGVGTYNLTLAIANPSASAATTAQVALTTGSLTNINNYTTQTVTFPSNSSSSQNVTLTVTDDQIVQGSRTLTFTIQNVSGGTSAVVGATSTFDLTITDNDASGSTVVLYEYFDKVVTGSIGNASSSEYSYPMDAYTVTAGWTGSKVYGAGGAVKLGTASALGYIVTPSLNLATSGGAGNIKFNIQTYGSDAKPIQVLLSTDGGTNWSQIGSNIATTAAMVTQTVNYTNASSTSKFKITATQAASGRFYLDTIIVTSNAPLPVELSSFSAYVSDGMVNLNWETKIEINNAGFKIERLAKDLIETGIKWESLGFVPGAGNSNSPKQYSFQDVPPAECPYFYRLKQMDVTGEFTHSKEILVNFTKNKSFILEQNYPNPFNPSTTIKFTTLTNSNVTLSVYNLLGEKVKTIHNGVLPQGEYAFSMDAGNLTSGTYIYELIADGQSQFKKMQLVK